MTDTRFDGARITSDGLTTSWLDVPAEDEQGTLQLSLIVQHEDGSEVRFGARWIRDAVDSPVVSAWDSRTVQERHHEESATAITREGARVDVAFPRSWIDALIDSHELHAVAVVTVDDVDGVATALDLRPED